jgi:[acyl-carrier-protein] S-malonyltransferase
MLSQGSILDIAQSSEFSHLVEYCSNLVSLDFVKLVETGPEELLNRTSITQPVLLLISYLHYQKLIEKINLDPILFAGHSLGEYSALVAANSLAIEDALNLVRARGLLMEEADNGSMAAILGLELSVIQDVCQEVSGKHSFEVQCANINTPTQTVISGTKEGVQIAKELCIEKGAKRAIQLNVSIASHSSLMKPLKDKFSKVISSINFKLPTTTILHNVTSGESSNIEELKEVLAKQLYSPVQWVKTCQKILELNAPVIECGPGKVIAGLMKANGLNDYFSTSDVNFYEKILDHVK